jgi:hypothetical protein
MQLARFMVPIAVLSVSCIADVSDSEPIDEDEELGIGRLGGPASPSPHVSSVSLDPVSAGHLFLATHHGACAEACFDVWAGVCNPCAEGDATVECAGVELDCTAAENAVEGGGAHDTLGLAYCWRTCERLRD